MDDSMLISMMIGIGVIVLVGGVGLVMSGSSATLAEQRLDGLTGQARGQRPRSRLVSGILLAPRPSTWAGARSGPSSFPTPRTSTCSTSKPT